MAMMIDEQRLLEVSALTLSSGAHGSLEDGACVLEAVSYVAGEEWSDHPQCACPVIASFLRSWNDGINDTETRTRLLKPLVPKLVGSKSTPAVELRRSYMALDWLVRVQTPAWLDAAGLRDKSALLRELGELHDEASCRAATEVVHDARRAADAASYAAWTAARTAAWTAARTAARAAASDAARTAAWAAARTAAWAAASDAAWAAAGAAASDTAGAAAWDAAWAAAWDAAGAAAWDAAWAAAWAAAWDALKATVESLQASALELVERMLAVTAAEAEGSET
jgi:hypothetical protein